MSTNQLTPIPQESCIKKLDTFFRRYSLPLIFGIFAGLIHANLDPETYAYWFATYTDIEQAAGDETKYLLLIPNFRLFGEYYITVLFIINQLFMVFFFGFVVKHIVESVLPPNGNMYPISKCFSPIISSIFGIITPISFYVSFILLFNIWWNPKHPIKTILHGWAIPMSTDIALSWTVATFIFNDHLDHRQNDDRTHPCISFLLLASIFDSIVGLVVIAIFYPKQQLTVQPIYILVIVGSIILAYISNKYFKIKQWWFYIFILGGISWIGFLLTAIHPALALVPIVPFMVIKNPRKIGQSQRVIYNYIGHNDESEVPSDDYLDDIVGSGDNASTEDDDLSVISETNIYQPYSLYMLNNFEKRIDRFVEYGLFFFTYANAGVHLSDFGNMTLCVFCAILFGKIIGITFGGWFSNLVFRIPLPSGMKLKQLPLIGFCASLSLTISLFISNIAFVENGLTNEAKMGALCAAGFGMFAGICYRIIYRLNKDPRDVFMTGDAIAANDGENYNINKKVSYDDDMEMEKLSPDDL